MKKTLKECLISGMLEAIACLIIYKFNIPNPNIILFVILSAVLVQYGYTAGIVSGIITFLYSAFFFSTNHSWFLYEPINRNKLIVIGLGIIANIIIIGQLQNKLMRTIEEKARLEKEILEKIAYTDGLTGLKNRYAYEADKKQAELAGTIPITLMVCDMNGLKQINDTMGHHYGDHAISQMGKLLEQTFRNHASCYRIGGDEFCVIAQKTETDIFEACKQEFLQLVSNSQVSDCKFSVAYGIASGSSANIDIIFREADQLMYTCKKEMKQSSIRKQT